MQSDLYIKPNEKCLFTNPTTTKFPRFHQVDSEKRLLLNAKDKSSLTRFSALRRGKDKKKSNTKDKLLFEKCNYGVIFCLFNQLYHKNNVFSFSFTDKFTSNYTDIYVFIKRPLT